MPFLLAASLIVVLAAWAIAAPAAGAGKQSLALKNGDKIFIYPLLEIPELMRQKRCDRYAFRNAAFELLNDGQYKTEDGETFLILQSCLMPMTGRTALADGSPVEFYQEDSFNTEGNLAFTFDDKGHRIPLRDGDHILAEGQPFRIIDGHISDYGAFQTSGKNND